MKKKNFAFISSDLINDNIEEADKLLMNEIKKSYNLVKINPADVFFKIEKNKTAIFINGKSIDNIDFALVRRIRNAEEKIYEIVKFLERNGTKILDQSNLLLGGLSAFNSILERYKKFNIPSSYYCSSLRSLNKFLATNKIDFSIIVKPNKGFKGKNVIKIDRKKDLLKFAKSFFKKNKENLFFQEYIDIKSEYRVFVIADKALGVVEKIAKDGAIARNYALGAKFVQVEKPRIKKLAEKLCAELKTNFSGVDIIEDRNGKLYVLECNRSPQFVGFRNTTKIEVEKEIIAYFSKSK